MEFDITDLNTITLNIAMFESQNSKKKKGGEVWYHYSCLQK
jgi:hypothetical protein